MSDQNDTLQKISENLKGLLNDAENAAKSISGKASEQISAASEQLRKTLGDLAANAECTVGKAKETAMGAAARADDAVRDNPWKAIGVAAVAGILVGTLLRKK